MHLEYRLKILYVNVSPQLENSVQMSSESAGVACHAPK